MPVEYNDDMLTADEEATEMAEKAEDVVQQLSTSHLKLILGDSLPS